VLDATLLILAGGASRRMGRPKALLPVGGMTMVEWIAGRLGPEFPEVLVSANDPELAPPGLQRVADLHPGLGPLAGIEAGLAAASHDALAVVACDLPRVTPEVVRLLVQRSEGRAAAVARVGGRPQPACACYRQSCLGRVRAALEEGRLKVADVLEELDVNWVEAFDPDLFLNINTQEDYQVFLSAL
jgi:molybdopterin-guanine dinucleotide biosynthesis protein A